MPFDGGGGKEIAGMFAELIAGLIELEPYSLFTLIMPLKRDHQKYKKYSALSNTT